MIDTNSRRWGCRLGTGFPADAITGPGVPVLWGAGRHTDRAGDRRRVAAGPDSARGTCGRCGPNPQATTGLLVDLYHLDAAYVSWRTGQNAPATFDLYTRSAPFGGAYLLTAGLEPALAFVRDFRYTEEDLAYLARIKSYDPAFLDELRRFRFTGEILAMPEGTVAFADEPLLRVTAPFREALLLESGLLRAIGVSTLIATKAARLVDAAAGREVADFGFRRAHDPYLAARSAFIGGCASTSFVAGAKVFDLPTGGTIPHALVQVFATEEEAFRAVAENLDRYSLLLDTYDVHTAIETAVAVALDARTRLGHEMVAVRLDSGDLLADSKHVRRVLDEAGLHETKVLVSGDIDEFRIADLLAGRRTDRRLRRRRQSRRRARHGRQRDGRWRAGRGLQAGLVRGRGRSGADQTGRGEEHVARPQAGLPDR